MNDIISRQAAIDAMYKILHDYFWANDEELDAIIATLNDLPSAQPDNRLSKIADLVEGTIDHFDLDDAMDLLYQIKDVLDGSDELPSAQPKPCEDAVSRQTLQNELALYPIDDVTSEDEAGYNRAINDVQKMVLHLPSAQPEQYTKEELKTFLHALSLRLLSLRSAQHWREDEKTAKEIEFLAHLYEKVEADMKGKA